MKTAYLLVALLLASASLGVLSGWGAEPPAVVVERELQRFNTAWPTKIQTSDPRFGIIRVLSLLKLDFPGLENVKAAEQAKLYDVAELELLAYFKRTRSAKEPVKALGAQERLHADDALRHYFRGNKDVHPPAFRGAKIDWTGRAFVDGQEIHDTYRTDSLGVLTFDKSGNHELAVKPKAPPKWNSIGLKSITLKPVE